MRALVYLLATRIKNTLLSYIKKPASLIFTLLMIGLIVMLVVNGHGTPQDAREMPELIAIVFALYGFVFYTTTYNGIGKGASLFSMADVNVLFTSGISPRRILLYGLIQRMGTSLFVGFFILYQYSWMNNLYGVNLGFLLMVMLGYGVCIFCGQLTAMVIYALTAGSERGKRVAKGMLIGALGLAACYVLVSMYLSELSPLAALVAGINSVPALCLPVSGWMTAMVSAFTRGQYLIMALMPVVTVGYIALMVALVMRAQTDYYEDVLKSTEVSFSAITAKKEGKLQEALPENIKLGKTGLGRGSGAQAFAVKQEIENRRGRRFLLDTMTLTFLLMNLAYAFFTRELGLISLFAFSTFMQIFNVSQGRWLRELLMPYIYMVPESPFKKLLANLTEQFRAIALEAVLLYIPAAFMLGLTPVEAVVAILARVSFGLLFLSGNMLVERLFSGLTIKPLVMTIFFLTMILLLAPSISAAAVVSVTMPNFLTENLRLLLPMVVVNIPLSLLLFFGCRNVLSYAELNNA